MGKALQASAGSETKCRFKVGRDRAGRWTVVDRQDRVGGFFVSRHAAVHFAMAESDYRPGAVWCMPLDETEGVPRPSAGNPAPARRAV